MAILDQARQRAAFQPPDPSTFVPPEQKDAVDRVVAAGQRIMYAPDMRQELLAEVKSKEPIPIKLAKAVTGLMLTLDQQSKGGIPQQALFPAALELLGEAATVLTKAGQQVTQDEYKEAARAMFVLMGHKLGLSQDEIMQGAQQALDGQGADAENDPEDQVPGHEQTEGADVEQQEDAGQPEAGQGGPGDGPMVPGQPPMPPDQFDPTKQMMGAR